MKSLIENFEKKVSIASITMKHIVNNTPLEYNKRLSKLYNNNIFIKREDLQTIRSFKIRGAFNNINSLSDERKDIGIVCASAGNHAQGVALSCQTLNIESDIFIPENTPSQKISRIQDFGKKICNIHLKGSTLNEALHAAQQFSHTNNKSFVHPYNNISTITGQGTIAKEIYDKIDPDIIIGSIGGGGLMSGVGLYSKNKNTHCLIYGTEPESCASMKTSITQDAIVQLEAKDNFVDGATVEKVGDITFPICKSVLDEIYISSTGKLCNTMLDLYQNDGIITEPAGALPFASLDIITKNITNKNIVCILSGGNNDVMRYPDIVERALRYKGLKHYYIIQFNQQPGELRKFINNILGPGDDITRFEYMKKTNKEFGNVLIGILLNNSENSMIIDSQLEINNFKFIKINENDLLYSYLI